LRGFGDKKLFIRLLKASYCYSVIYFIDVEGRRMLLVKKNKSEKGLKMSFMIDEDVGLEFKKLAKQKRLVQNAMIQNAILLLIEEMKKMK